MRPEPDDKKNAKKYGKMPKNTKKKMRENAV
jgi:hypothetical protein